MCGDGSGKREITDFESPIEVDIDKKIPVLVAAHTALYDCINAVIDEMDYKQYAIQFGGKMMDKMEKAKAGMPQKLLLRLAE